MWSRLAIVVTVVAFAFPALADPPMTTLQIEVANHKDKPVDRASVIVKFVEGRSIKKLGKKTVRQWELKTNQSGVAKVPPLPQGKILVMVIAERYQTFAENYEIEEEEKTIQIKLNPPQPQYSAH